MMSRNKRDCLRIMYSVGGVVIFVLAVVALVSFCKAVTFEAPKPVQPHGFADSIIVENLQKEVAALTQKVDSLDGAMRQTPPMVYRNFKSKKGSSVIELHFHNE